LDKSLLRYASGETERQTDIHTCLSQYFTPLVGLKEKDSVYLLAVALACIMISYISYINSSMMLKTQGERIYTT